MSKTALVWVLITVSPQAEVHHDLFGTQDQCEEAEFFAVHGYTKLYLEKIYENSPIITNGRWITNGEPLVEYSKCIKVDKETMK